ncbi:MAG: T9SS type A sorting domain-containing protein, partial [Saprospiraceae bacterium]|nr:T9SS type A sorting domain-containing protein [Saprospiraceae bacterium]
LVVQGDGSGCTTQGTGEQVMVTEEMTPSMTNAVAGRKKMAGHQSNAVSGDAFGLGNFIGEGYDLEQNQPNPFQVATQIGFTLPQSMDARIEVFDVTGRMLKSIQGAFIKGYNTVEFQRADLRQSGVLYYRLHAGDYVATKRMIVID